MPKIKNGSMMMLRIAPKIIIELGNSASPLARRILLHIIATDVMTSPGNEMARKDRASVRASPVAPIKDMANGMRAYIIRTRTVMTKSANRIAAAP